MKRRKFLKLASGTAIATTAMSALPQLLRAQQVSTTILFDNSYQKSTASNHFAIRLDPQLMKQFENVSKDLRNVTVAQSASFDTTFEQEIAFDVRKVEMEMRNSEELYIAQLGKGDLLKGSENSLPENFPFKKPTLIFNQTTNTLLLINRDGETFIELKKYTAPSGGSDYNGDCYSTVALVSVMGFQDNSQQMESLRMLRESFVRSSEQGLDKLQAYRELSADIIAKLNELPNQNEIYEHTYHKIIQPSLQFIESNQPLEAMNLMGDFLIRFHQMLH